MTHDDSLYYGVADGLHRITELGVSSYEAVLIVVAALYLLWVNRLFAQKRYHILDGLDKVLTYILGIAFFTLPMSQLLCSHEWSLLFAVVLGWHALFIVQAAILWLSCYLSYNEPLFGDIMKFKARYITKTIVWSLPISLAAALSEQIQVSFYLAVTQSVVVLIRLICQSNVFFRAKKISIFTWILYLCTVKIVPTILLWAILSSKYSAN